MSKEVIISQENRVGIIALNRPKAINALNRNMLDMIEAALIDFENNDSIKGVLIESATERGFCSGGDIRLARQYILDKQEQKMYDFFRAEYSLDGHIAQYKKPIIALCDGIIMGGGLGLAGNAKYRFATKRSIFAMPEAAIGFVCDCGIDAILANIDRHRALAFLLSGQTVTQKDAIKLNLTDYIIANDRLLSVRQRIIAAINNDNIEQSIEQIMNSETDSDLTIDFLPKADSCKEDFTKNNISEILFSLQKSAASNKHAKEFYQIISKHCPTSLAAIIISHDRVRKIKTSEKSLQIDYILATWMARRNDFSEGVRAMLIDKCKNPKWHPNKQNEVDEAEILALINKIC